MRLWLSDPSSRAELEVDGDAAPGDVLLADGMHPNDLKMEGTCCCRADGALLIAWYDGEVSWISAAGALYSALIADRCVNVQR